MNDRELVELAAKAVGVTTSFDRPRKDWGWNPLDDNGTALWLAVELNMFVTHRIDSYINAGWPDVMIIAKAGDDPHAATRRAIVKAAAEAGKGVAR